MSWFKGKIAQKYAVRLSKVLGKYNAEGPNFVAWINDKKTDKSPYREIKIQDDYVRIENKLYFVYVTSLMPAFTNERACNLMQVSPNFMFDVERKQVTVRGRSLTDCDKQLNFLGMCLFPNGSLKDEDDVSKLQEQLKSQLDLDVNKDTDFFYLSSLVKQKLGEQVAKKDTPRT